MSDKKSLMDTIEDTDIFSVFARLMRTSGLKDIIGGNRPLTIFAPTNDAFRKIPDHVMNGWLSEKNQERLSAVLGAHIVADRLMAATFGLSCKTAISICGTSMQFTDEKGLRVNKASVQARNIEASDGVIHALDTVLMPDEEHASNNQMAWGGKVPQVEGDLAPATANAREKDAYPPMRRKASPEREWKLS